jgi:hypothetical protein
VPFFFFPSFRSCFSEGALGFAASGLEDLFLQPAKLEAPLAALGSIDSDPTVLVQTPYSDPTILAQTVRAEAVLVAPRGWMPSVSVAFPTTIERKL